jgi:hypothetical protein
VVDTKSQDPPASGGGAAKSKKKKSTEEVQRELRELGQKGESPPVDLKKGVVRGAAILAVVWVIAFIVPYGWAKIAAAVLSVAAVGLYVWVKRYVTRTQQIGALLRGADTQEARKEALKKLETEFKKDDTSAVLARAQLEMQEDPRKALETLESINLDKVMAPIAAQVRAMRAQIHLVIGEVPEARALVDKLDLDKQQDAKTRAMFATVASEAWARSGQAKKALDTLDLFNPEDPDMAELKPQIWRARAFAYAAQTDTKGIGRALRKLADMNPHLLGMFVGQKKIHPLLEREAKQLVLKLGVVPKKMAQRRM